jgi:hypothetical protein
MARIIIGAGAGYLLGLFFFALINSGVLGSSFMFHRFATFQSVSDYSFQFNYLLLACVAVGGVMGWAWHTIAVDADSKDD